VLLERVKTGHEKAKLIAFGVGKNVPCFIAGLADVGRTRPKTQEAFEFGVLIAVGGVDVDVQARLPRFRLIPAAEDDRRLWATEPFAWPDLDHLARLAVKHHEIQYFAPELRQYLGVMATEYKFTDTTCHGRNLLSRELPGRPSAKLGAPWTKIRSRAYRARRAVREGFMVRISARWCARSSDWSRERYWDGAFSAAVAVVAVVAMAIALTGSAASSANSRAICSAVRRPSWKRLLMFGV
jgi:hypothetical protein